MSEPTNRAKPEVRDDNELDRYHRDSEYQNGYDEGFNDALYVTDTPKIRSIADAKAKIHKINELLKARGESERLNPDRAAAFLKGYQDGFADGLERHEEIGV